MNRFKITEITGRRLYDALARRIRDLPHAIAWKRHTGFSEINRSRLESYRNKHIGQRCFIMGNGPSLKDMDLSPLKNEITFGLNRIYLLFGQMQFLPTYYVAMNDLVLGQFSSEIQRLVMPKFLNWNMRSRFNIHDESINFVRLKFSVSDGFAEDFSCSLYSGGTVTYVALQIAFAMGFSQAVLIGVDHSFSDKGIPNKIEMRESTTDVNHFHPEYFPKGVKWQLPDLQRSELAYMLARNAFEKNGRKIIDATMGGKCPVFQRVDFHGLF